jgi:hypothetical protein
MQLIAVFVSNPHRPALAARRIGDTLVSHPAALWFADSPFSAAAAEHDRELFGIDPHHPHRG